MESVLYVINLFLFVNFYHLHLLYNYCFIIIHMSGQGKHSWTNLFIVHLFIHFTLHYHRQYIWQKCVHFQEAWLASKVICNIRKLFDGTCFLMMSETCSHKRWLFSLGHFLEEVATKSQPMSLFVKELHWGFQMCLCLSAE